jgi:geranylgeranyl diphosphate synthase type II
MDFNKYLDSKRIIFEDKLNLIFLKIGEEFPEILLESMKYSVFAGGKRLRPVLAYATCESLDGPIEDAINIGCALEFIHTYSLIHDDLPAMDNDDYRRGKLTNHKVFGEAIAILAGDALLTEAFNILSNLDFYKNINSDTLLEITNFISVSAGAGGMVGGQVYDLIYQNKKVSNKELELIHLNKTAKLITASIFSGARVATNNRDMLNKFINYGRYIGMGFQIVDDILDVEGDFKKLGKTVGKDLEQNKITYPMLYGIEQSKEIAKNYIGKALKEIEFLNNKGEALKEIANFILKRVY